MKTRMSEDQQFPRRTLAGIAVGYTFYSDEETNVATRIASTERNAGDVDIVSRRLSSGGKQIFAEYGRLLVPENRSKPDSNLIELAFVRLKSTA